MLHGDIEPDIAQKLDHAAAAVRAARTQPAAGAVELAAPRTKPAPAEAPHPAPSELAPGTRLVKIYGGQTHVVEVTAGGMLYQDQLYSSLSAVAKAITGTHWNGLLFFGLRKRKTYPKAGTDG